MLSVSQLNGSGRESSHCPSRTGIEVRYSILLLLCQFFRILVARISFCVWQIEIFIFYPQRLPSKWEWLCNIFSSFEWYNAGVEQLPKERPIKKIQQGRLHVSPRTQELFHFFWYYLFVIRRVWSHTYSKM